MTFSVTIVAQLVAMVFNDQDEMSKRKNKAHLTTVLRMASVYSAGAMLNV
jgi:hypothetical protein